MEGNTFELKPTYFLDQNPPIYGEVNEELTVIEAETNKPVIDNQQPAEDGKETESCDGMGYVTRFLTSVAAYVATLVSCRTPMEDQV